MKFTDALVLPDHNFENILEIMKLRREPQQIDSLRNILLTINQIVDYYLEKEDDQLKVIVSYFPMCSDFAQEISEEFICLKFGLYTNETWQSIIANKLNHSYFYVPSTINTQKQKILAKENYTFEKHLSRILKKTDKEYYGHGETLIYSDYLYKQFTEYKAAQNIYNNRVANKYWYLSHAITYYKKNISSECPLQLIHQNADELYENLITCNGYKTVENMVVFPMKTPDGRYSDFCAEFFQKPYLDDFVNSSLGLRNVFIFCFSRKPYRLRRLIDFKQRMKEHIQINDDNSYEFISFTHQESRILNRIYKNKVSSISIGIDNNEIQQDYELLLDDTTNGLDFEVLKRNEMSLCLTPEAIDLYCDKLIEETEIDEILLREIFSQNLSLWKKDAEIKIKHFVFRKKVFVVIANNILPELQQSFKNLLINFYGATSVEFGSFSDLRGYNSDGQYRNLINYNRILVMSFKNDYTESIFHKYPNSFDPICINEYQKLLVVNNYFTLRNYYDWGKYNYLKATKKILKSEFRSSNMKVEFQEFKKPTKKMPSENREDEPERNVPSRSSLQMKVVFEDGSTQSIFRSEWILYKTESTLDVAPLYDIPEILDSCKQVQIQTLTPLIKQICRTHIDLERDKDFRSERMFKEQESYGLSKEEIESNVQLWKILLAKKIKEFSSREVYDEIMSHFNERYKVSYHSFKRWLEPDYGIPRARKMQKFLVENYLGIRPPYINLIRRIKERTKSDTESITIKVREFLRIALTVKSSTKVLELLSDDIKDLLDITGTKDITRIKSTVSKIIKLETINNIIQ